MANVTKRTASNYRYYSQESLEDLRLIETCKQPPLSLQEIKEALTRKKQEKQPDIVHQANDAARRILDSCCLPIHYVAS
jgi:MerR family transcriptional regulator, copper efflux regulator